MVPERDEKEAATGADEHMAFRIQARPKPIKGAIQAATDKRLVDNRAQKQRAYCNEREGSEVTIENCQQPVRLAFDRIGTKPFYMGKRAYRRERKNEDGQAGKDRAPRLSAF